MPLRKVAGGWRIGQKGAVIKTKRKALRAYRAYLYKISHPTKR